MHRLSLLTLPLLLGGCTLLGKPNLEGTWMFMFDRNTQASGDCVDPDDTSTTTYTGTADQMIEIFKTADGAYAVNLGVFLVGDWNDEKVFEASYVNRDETVNQGGTSVSRDETWLMASWADGALSGSAGTDSLDTTTPQNGEATSYSCNQENEFTAVKITSNESKYVED